MARRTTVVTVEADGRDAGKKFLLTELPASQGERWATRALMALAKGGADLPDDVMSMGMAGIAFLGLNALAHMPMAEAEPLLAEMFQCVQSMPDPTKPNIVRDLIETDIEEISTRIMLRREVMRLHIGFFPSVASLTSALTAAAGALASSNTETSPAA